MRRFTGHPAAGILIQALGLVAFAEVGRSSWGAPTEDILKWMVLGAIVIGTIGIFYVALGNTPFGRITLLVAVVTVGFVLFEQAVAFTIYPGLDKGSVPFSAYHFERLGEWLTLASLHNLFAAAVAYCGKRFWAAKRLRFLVRWGRMFRLFPKKLRRLDERTSGVPRAPGLHPGGTVR